MVACLSLRFVLVTACQLDITAHVNLFGVPQADDTFSIHTAQSASLQLGEPSTVPEADLSFSIHTVRASVVPSFHVDTQTGPYMDKHRCITTRV